MLVSPQVANGVRAGAGVMVMLRETMLIKKFNGLSALSTMIFTVEDGEIIAPLQPSSSGETTILRAIGGIDFLDSGHAMCDGAAAMDLHGFTVTG